MLHALIANLAVVALLSSIWAHAQHFVELRSRHLRGAIFGMFMGAGAIATMALGVEVLPGISYDLRGTVLALAGLLGGPVSSLISLVMAAGYRLVIGGPGVMPGIGLIIAASACGCLFRLARRRNTRPMPIWLLLTFALVLAVYTALGYLTVNAPGTVGMTLEIGALIGAITFVVTFVSAAALQASRTLARERVLLRAAMDQAPDFFYVKDQDHRFLIVNQAVAAFNGFASPREMVGKTDADLTTPARADVLIEAERAIMQTGEPIIGLEERYEHADRRIGWFATSKSALRDDDGSIIGIAGVTRDITMQKQLEHAAHRDHQLLSVALEEMSEGLAMFDRDGYLVLSNRNYREAFPLTGHLRRPGAHIRDLLQAVLDTGEQMPPQDGDNDRWIDEVIASFRRESVTEAKIAENRFLQFRTRPIQDGAVLVVVSDVTEARRSEMALRGLTDQLQELATTDSLTGLLNRRGFDHALGAELARTGRDRHPISLLMIDVDRFKPYNDHYGHQAGDACFKLVAACLRESALRPGDSFARYGGEEFAAILPNTDEDGAYVIAERLRKGLRGLGLPHAASEKGVVTVSIGIACYRAAARDRSDTELIRRADDALYDAKAAGRDRVTGWRGTEDVVPHRSGAPAHRRAG